MSIHGRQDHQPCADCTALKSASDVRAEVLRDEIEWFTEAATNARDNALAYGFHPEYLRGFDAALGWLEHHLKMAEAGQSRPEVGA